MKINGKTVVDYEVCVDSYHGPDDYDAYFKSAVFDDGTDASDDELETLTDEYAEVVAEAAWNNRVCVADFMN